MMGLKDDVEILKKEAQQIRQESFAMDLLKDYKAQNKRLFIIWIITFVAFMLLLVYTVWLLNDISNVETTESTQEIHDIDTIDNSTIKNGGE